MNKTMRMVLMMAAAVAVFVAPIGALAVPHATVAPAPSWHAPDLSSLPAIEHYLLTKGIDPATAVVQRGIRNYAGPNCPGKGWTCAGTDRPVIQMTESMGANQFQCTPSGSPGPNECVIVQTSSGADNNATCLESTEANNVAQSCQVTQTNTTGANNASVTQTILHQAIANATGSQSATVTQTNNSGANSLTSTQTVTQQSSLSNPGAKTQSQESHQSLDVNQDTTGGGGSNTATLKQKLVQHADASSGPSTTQKQNAVDSGPNLLASVQQNSSSGAQNATLDQASEQHLDGTGPGPVVQKQGTAGGGHKGTVNQSSTGISKWTVTEYEEQHANAGTSLAVTQTQYGPIICCSSQGTNPADTCKLTQTSSQHATSGKGGMTEFVNGKCSTSGSGQVSQSVEENGTTTTNNCTDQNCNKTIGCSGGTCTNTAPVAGVSPSSLTFAARLINTTSPAQTVTVSNTGNAPLNVTSATIGGANPGDFAKSSDTCSGTSIVPGGSCAIGVTFTPTAQGSRTASLAIADNDPTSPQTVSLSGTGLAPAVGLNPSSLTFDPRLIGTTSAPQSVTVSNAGDGDLIVTGVTVGGTNPGDFAVASDTCSGSTVPPGGTCAIGVTFTPAASGSRSAALSIADNAPNSPQTVPLSGTGLADTTAPVSTFTTADGSILVTTNGDKVRGTATDDLSGVTTVVVQYREPSTPAIILSTVTAVLTCTDSSHLSCTWAADLPISGTYTVTVKATDASGNVESPGPAAITVVVI